MSWSKTNARIEGHIRENKALLVSREQLDMERVADAARPMDRSYVGHDVLETLDDPGQYQQQTGSAGVHLVPSSKVSDVSR